MIMECKVTARKSHYPKEVPFEVPKGWAMSTVMGVFQINPKNHEDDSTEAGFVPMANISDGFEDKYSYEVKPWKSIKSGFTHFRNRDIAVAKISPCLENRKSFVARGLPQEIGAGTTELFIFRSSQINPEYGLLFFKSEFFISNCVGTFNGVVGQQRVARAIIEEMPFPIPPIAEQERIVQSVNSIFTMICEVENNQSALKNSIEKSKALILDLAIHGKLVPQDSSDEPAIALLKRINPDFQPSYNLHYGERLPNGWTCGLFGDLNQHRNKSEDPLASPNEEYELYSVPIYETGMPEFLHGKEIGSTKQIVDKGDVLLCKINPHLNRSWVVSHYHPELKCIASSEWLIFANEAVLPDFARLFFISPQFKELMLSNVSGVGGSLMRARASAVNNYPIWIPPINEQKRIVKAVYQLYDAVDSLASNLD